MEIQDTRSISGNKEEPISVEVNGTVEGFEPAFNKVLIRRLPPPPEGAIIAPQIAMEQSERGVVIAIGLSSQPACPVGSIAKFSKYAEEIHFDDEGSDSYVLPWIQDVRGWHARD